MRGKINTMFTLKLPRLLFDERKAAQAAAFLLHRAGGELPLIKLMKLLYLSERLSLQRYGEPLTGDRMVSMPYGPVLSMTYEHSNGNAASSIEEGGWSTWISDRAEHKVALADKSMINQPTEDLLALSDSDIEVLSETWGNFGRMSHWDIVNYTHNPNNCPEWQDPEGSSKPITYEKLFSVFGFSATEASEAAARIDRFRQLKNA
jgi:uncharacterized phage-associated protein